MAELSAPRFLDRNTPPNVVTLTLIVAAGALSMNVFLPSLPGMAEYFQADYRLMQLSVALYLAVNAALQIVIGPISDRVGRRPVILWSFTLFLLATLGCIMAPNVHVFLGFRMAQAVIVGGMAISRAAVRDIYPPDRAASMLGYVTMGMSIVPMAAPAIGGVLDQAFGWKANFWIQVVMGAGVLWLVWRDMGETAQRHGGSLRDQIREYPELLLSRQFWGYCAAAALSAGAFFSYLGGAPFVGSVIYHMAPATMGVFFGAPSVGYLFGNWFSGRYSVRLGLNRMIMLGASVATVGLALSLIVFYAGHGSQYVFFGFMIPLGLGNGILLPNANAGMLSVRPHLAGSAAGLGGAILIGGGAALSATAGWLLSPTSGAYPLLWLMVASSALSLVAILLVIRRQARLGL